MPTSDRKLRVFLCHALQDKPIVRELYQRLLAEGWIDPWLDEEKLLPGQDWNIEIENAVEKADSVIVCISNNSVKKDGYIQREVNIALEVALEKPEGSVFIIPLRLNKCSIPRRLKSYQYVDFFPMKHRDVAYKKILQSLMFRGNEIGIMPIRLIQTDDSTKALNNNRKTIRLKDYHPEQKTYPVPSSFDIQYRRQAYVPDGVSHAVLLVVESEQKDIIGMWIQIQKDEVSLGRAIGNDIVFPNDSCVSRYHAIIKFHNNKWILRESVQHSNDGFERYPINGTFINGQKIDAPVFLETNDEIRFGPNLCLRFQSLV